MTIIPSRNYPALHQLPLPSWRCIFRTLGDRQGMKMITLIEKRPNDKLIGRELEPTIDSKRLLEDRLIEEQEYILMPKSVYDLLSDRNTLYGPSSRELEALHLARQGMTNSEIAVEMRLGEGTVRNYLSGLYETLGASNRLDAISKAIELGLLPPTSGQTTYLPVVHLTDRETEILGLIRKGLTNDEIAEMMSLSAGTTRNYISTIYRKLKVKNRTEAVRKAIRLNILQP